MGIGKKLLILGCCAFAACAILVMAVLSPAISTLIITGKPLCVPGVSIRCHERDCGNYFQRCGSKVLHEVPPHKVCHGGALLPAKRADLHSCSSASDTVRNSTQNLQTAAHLGSAVGACTCACTWPGQCNCLCSTQGQQVVVCGGKSYSNAQVAACCHATGCRRVHMLEWILDYLSRQFSELSIEEWLETIAASFTFQSPLPALCAANCCAPGGSCANVCG